MARSDLLLTLVRSGTQGDDQLFRKAVEALIAEERAKQHHILADQLAENLRPRAVRALNRDPHVDERTQQLFFETEPIVTFDDLLLPDEVALACKALVEEQFRVDLLRSYNLEPRHRILLTGPPGNGKTSLAEAIATALSVPLFVVRYEGVIGSYLGETAARLRLLFDYVRTRRCVLFFDEFDAIGKERGDIHETGEIKRVVSSLLMQIDRLPSHVVIVTASNHPELLDRAVWRRFQLRLLLPLPSIAQLEKFFQRMAQRWNRSLGAAPRTLATELHGLSFAEVTDFTTDIQRRYVLSLPNANPRTIMNQILREWRARFSLTRADGDSP